MTSEEARKIPSPLSPPETRDRGRDPNLASIVQYATCIAAQYCFVSPVPNHIFGAVFELCMRTLAIWVVEHKGEQKGEEAIRQVLLNC